MESKENQPAAVESQAMADMVSRFLSWPLPTSLCADNCATMPSYSPRTGTNLMTAAEAEAMLTHVLDGRPAPVNAHPLLAALENVSKWIESLPVPTTGAAGQLVAIDKAIAAAKTGLAHRTVECDLPSGQEVRR